MAYSVGIMNGNADSITVRVEEFEISRKAIGQVVLSSDDVAGGDGATVDTSDDTNRIYIEMTTKPEPKDIGDATMLLTIDNPNSEPLRVVYGDATRHTMEEIHIGPGQTQPVQADGKWKVEITLMGVPYNAPSFEDQQGNG